MKCKNCGGTEFAPFKEHFECIMCGYKMVVEDTVKEEKEDELNKTFEELIAPNPNEKLYNSLRMYFEQPSLNYEEIKSLANEIIRNDSKDLYARCILAFIDRDRFPENYKNALCELTNAEIDDEKIEWIIPAFIKNSEYKFINSIGNFLVDKGLYKKFSAELEEAEARIEKENENFSSAPRDVFICYSSNDTIIAEKIVEHLEDDGNTCWFAKRNIPQNSLSQIEYRAKIKDAMSKCKIIVVIASKNSMLSKEVENELDYADELGIKNRIEYRIEPVDNTTRFKSFFDGIQWIDASYAPQYFALINQVYDMLHQKPVIEVKPREIVIDPQKVEEIIDKLDIDFKSRLIEIDSNDDSDDVAPSNNVFIEEVNKDEPTFDKDEFTDSCCTELEKLSFEKQEAVALSLFKKNEYASAIKILNKLNPMPTLDNLTLYYVGECLYNGLGIDKDVDSAMEYYNLAKTQSPKGEAEDLGVCYYNLGMKHINGECLEKNEQEAMELFERAKKYKNTKAIYNLGMLYKSKNLVRAIECFNQVAQEMPAKAYLQLGICYAKLNNTPKAVECYRISATHKEAIAMTNLGSLYYYGKGVEPSYEKAIHWFTQGALNGNATAQFNLGNCYQKGRGTSVDLERAKSWYQKAAQNGNEEAKKRLEELQG